MTATLDAMLAYANLGWPVVPLHNPQGDACSCSKKDDCPSPAKHPRTEHGLKDATVNPGIITGWCERWPNANVGLLTGVAFDVLDIDGPQADTQLGRAAGGHLASLGPEVATGRGWHLYFAPTGGGNKTGLIDHVDWRGAGGYVVAPPSLHISGTRYTWEPGCGPEETLEPVPPWLLALLNPPRPAVIPWATAPPAHHQDKGAYGQRALEVELGRLACTQPGGRNDAVNRAAFNLGQLVASGHLEASAVADALLRVAAAIGLTEAEAVPTITSGMATGMRTPRRTA
ncbi:MAG: bifunctional DNA primase/polymerase [Acidimicrobiales bacterium]